MPGWRRALLGALCVVTTAVFLRSFGMTGWKWLARCALAIAVATAGMGATLVAGATASSAAVVVAIGIVVALATAHATAVYGAASSGTLATAAAGAIAAAFAVGAAVAVVGAGAGAVAVAGWAFGFGALVLGLSLANELATIRGWQGPFLSFFVAMMIGVCLMDARLLSPLYRWEVAGPLLLLLPLLTLLNAPFDWASLGLTRALLRRGLELGGWWPYTLGIADACLAAVIIAALALTMVVGVQAFDALAVHGGGKPVLPLDALFTGIAEHPSAPEYWWLYAMLLSTMIPSLVNLVIGGTSLVRGSPGLPALLLRYIPERGGVLRWDRHWIAAILTAQVAAGAALGIAAQVFLVWAIIGYVMPFFGLELLEMARDVAAFNLPAQVGQLFGVNL